MKIVTLIEKDKTTEKNRMTYMINRFYIELDLKINVETNNIKSIIILIIQKILNENRNL